METTTKELKQDDTVLAPCRKCRKLTEVSVGKGARQCPRASCGSGWTPKVEPGPWKVTRTGRGLDQVLWSCLCRKAGCPNRVLVPQPRPDREGPFCEACTDAIHARVEAEEAALADEPKGAAGPTGQPRGTTGQFQSKPGGRSRYCRGCKRSRGRNTFWADGLCNVCHKRELAAQGTFQCPECSQLLPLEEKMPDRKCCRRCHCIANQACADAKSPALGRAVGNAQSRRARRRKR